jgi:hypothetical protein
MTQTMNYSTKVNFKPILCQEDLKKIVHTLFYNSQFVSENAYIIRQFIKKQEMDGSRLGPPIKNSYPIFLVLPSIPVLHEF